MSLKSRLLSYLQRNPDRSVPSGELQRLAMEAGYTPQNAGRRLRELETEGSVMVHYEKSERGASCAVYQFKPKEIIQTPVRPLESIQAKLI